MAPLSNLVVCVDASAHSEQAWLWALRLLSAATKPLVAVRLICVAVAPPLDLMDDADVPWVIASRLSGDDRQAKEAEKLAVEAASVVLRDLMEQHPPPKHARVQLLTPMAAGSIGETICAAVGEDAPDLCVCGARGLSAFKRFLAGVGDALLIGLGSVSDYLVHHASYPVCVVKTAAQKQEA